MYRRRAFELGLIGTAALLFTLMGCGGAPSRLVTVKSGTGEGPIQLEVLEVEKNRIRTLRATVVPVAVTAEEREAD